MTIRSSQFTLLPNTGVALSQTSDSRALSLYKVLDVMASITVANPDDQEFVDGTAEVQTLTFPDLGDAEDGDYVVFYDRSGTPWAIALDKYGLGLSTPTGAAWTAVAAANKVYADMSGDGTAEVQTLTFPALAGAADGDYIVFYDVRGRPWAIALDTTGAAAQEPTGAEWVAIPAARKDYVDISGATTAAQVAAAVEVAMNALTDFTDYFTTDDTAADGTMLLTSDINGAITDAVPHDFEDSGAGSISAVETTPGVWATEVEVAAAAELEIDGLTGLTAVITTDDTAADGTMLLTQVVRGPTTDPVPKSFDDAGAGSILGVETTPGVQGVSLADNSVVITGHGYLTGTKCQLTTTGTLPTGLALATDYYIIAVDADTIKFASSQANALAGTAVDITAHGSGTHTVAVVTTLAGSVKLQKSNSETTNESPVWFDIASSSQNFSGTTVLNWAYADVAYNLLRAVVTTTSGTATVGIEAMAKE